jgi:hypothetical protein
MVGTRPAFLATTVVLAALASCDTPALSGADNAGDNAPLPVATTPPAASPGATATTTVANAEDGEPVCEKALPVSPRALSAAWPTMVGKRVSFVGRIRRSLGFGEALVVVGGARFDVLMSPSDVWTGSARRSYRVTGSSTVRVGGPTRLPQLLLEPDGCAGE